MTSTVVKEEMISNIKSTWNILKCSSDKYIESISDDYDEDNFMNLIDQNSDYLFSLMEYSRFLKENK